MLKKFQGPFLILKCQPEYRTYKLQNCETKRVHSSLIYGNRLRLCDDDRDKLYSRHFVPSREVEMGLKCDRQLHAANAENLDSVDARTKNIRNIRNLYWFLQSHYTMPLFF